MAQIQSNQNSVQETPKYLTISKVLVYAIYAWALFGTILLGLRVLLLAFSANPSTQFVTFIYETSANYLAPFRGIFPSHTVGQTGYLDVSALFAIIMYLLFVWGLSSLIKFVQFKIDQQQTAMLADQVKPVRTTTNAVKGR